MFKSIFSKLKKTIDTPKEQPFQNTKIIHNENKTKNETISNKVQWNLFLENQTNYDEAQCPDCSHQFEKQVTRKRKCPSCGQTLVVRTHFSSKNKLLFLESDIEKYEKEARKYYDQNALKRLIGNVGLTDEFVKQMNDNPKNFSSFDIAWGLFNQQGLKHAQDMNWGLYTNIRSSMGQLLMRENRKKEALHFLLEVCYFDINGANNNGGIPIDLQRYPAFRPNNGYLAPGIISMIEDIIEELNLSIDEVKELYIKHNTKIRNSLIPLSPEESWLKLETELNKDKKTS